MQTPFELLDSGQRAWLLILLVLGMLMWILIVYRFLPPAPGGIVRYELAWTRDNADALLKDWNAEQKTLMARDIKLDFAFILFYALAFSLACAMTSKYPNDWSTFGVFLSWAFLVAGLCDVIENISLLQMLQASASSLSAGVAGFFSSIKWLIILAGGLYVLFFGIPQLLSFGICRILDGWLSR